MKKDIITTAFTKHANKIPATYRDLLFLDDREKPIVYTNGKILLSTVETIPEGAKTIDKSGKIESGADKRAPNICNIIDNNNPNYQLFIPKDFYPLLKAFKLKKKDLVWTRFTEEGISITVGDQFDKGEEDSKDFLRLNYKEVHYPQLQNKILTIDLRILKFLQPEKLSIQLPEEIHVNKSVRIDSSYCFDTTNMYCIIAPALGKE